MDNNLTTIEVAEADLVRKRIKGTLSRLSRTGDMPCIPAVATRALAMAEDRNVNIDELCRIIHADVGITARVLRLANSPVYGRRTGCGTLHDAVTDIGLRGVCDLLVTASLRQLCNTNQGAERALWDHSLAVGLASRELAPMLGFRQPGSVFLAGLFHDVGRIAFFIADPEMVSMISHFEANGPRTRYEMEREWYGFDHAEAGAALAADWGLPPDTCEAIRWHHEPARAEGSRSLAELINLADQVAHGIGLNGGAHRPPAGEPLRPKISPEDLQASAERTLAAFGAQKSLFE